MIEVIGKNGISAKMLKDSISPTGDRMRSFEIVAHRYILAEENTHRALSKNSASSRAVPLDKAIQHVKDFPAYPVHWGAKESGMQARSELTGAKLLAAKVLWGQAISNSLDLVQQFDDIGAHKQWAARWLETGQMMKTVISGTDWDNFFWLRNDEEAQPEFGELARCMQECTDQSVPQLLFAGEWHVPYIESDRDEVGNIVYLDSTGDVLTTEEAKMISASCCAQVSYRRLNDTKDKAIEIYNKLFSGRKPHCSPVEHQSTPIVSTTKNIPYDFSTWELGVTHVDRSGKLHSGNLSGWIQLRNTLPNNVFVKS